MISHSINSPTNYDIGMLSQNFGYFASWELYCDNVETQRNIKIAIRARAKLMRDIAKCNKIQNFPFIVLQHPIDCISIGIGQWLLQIHSECTRRCFNQFDRISKVFSSIFEHVLLLHHTFPILCITSFSAIALTFATLMRHRSGLNIWVPTDWSSQILEAISGEASIEKDKTFLVQPSLLYKCNGKKQDGVYSLYGGIWLASCGLLF